MHQLATRPLGRTGIILTELGFGAASLGELFVRVSEADSQATLQSAWDSGIRYFDTAPWYGRGLSELRVGAGLRDHPRSDFVISTKCGRYLRAATAHEFDSAPWLGGSPNEVVFDYTYDGIMRSTEQSRLRIGLTRFEMSFIHDLDYRFFDAETVESHFRDLERSGFRALEELRADGLIGAIGVGINELGLISRFLNAGDIDVFLVAMPYTLLDQQVLESEFPGIVARGIGVVVGAVYASGILATGPVAGARYGYRRAPMSVRDKVRRIEAVCARHGVPLAAAALQFPLGHPAVASVIPGASTPEQQSRTRQAFDHPISGEFWLDLKRAGLLREDAPTPSRPESCRFS